MKKNPEYKLLYGVEAALLSLNNYFYTLQLFLPNKWYKVVFKSNSIKSIFLPPFAHGVD